MKRILSLLLVVLLAAAISGCATMERKQTPKTPMAALQDKVTELEAKQAEQAQEIADLKNELVAAQASSKGTEVSVSSAPAEKTKENIQKALKAAGYYDGAIDGKIGQKTKKGIISFQEANALTADGVVGKKTWSKLKQYLY